MFEVILTRKRDDYKSLVAGSIDFSVAYKSAMNVARKLLKAAGAIGQTTAGVWESPLIEIRINDVKVFSPHPDWKDDEWTKEKLEFATL